MTIEGSESSCSNRIWQHVRLLQQVRKVQKRARALSFGTTSMNKFAEMQHILGSVEALTHQRVGLGAVGTAGQGVL